MRLRNVKNAKEILNNSKYFIKNPEENITKWDEVFNNSKPIRLEIGMGKGDFLIKMAEKNPDYNFVGVEKYESVLVRAVQKMDELNMDNIKVINVDAIELNKIFNKEIDTIYLNFSDPWPKKRHYKRRLTYRDFLKVYDELFLDTKNIIMKTDNDSLFESSLIELNNYGYVFDDLSLDLWSTDKENVRTEYENKFGSKGLKIKYIKVHKK